jgi:hypothetical protein
MRILGVRPLRCVEGAKRGDVPLLQLSITANEKIPDGEMSRIRDFVLDRESMRLRS